MELRRPEAIERELWQLGCDLEARSLSAESLRCDIEQRDVYDAGRTDATRAQLERDADHGRLTNGYRKGHAYRVLSDQERELQQVRAAMRDCRRELAVWSLRVPVGMVEIAALLGYSADAPRQWKHRHVLPPAAGTLSGTPWWWRADVLRWALDHGRTRAILPDNESATDYEEDVTCVA